jgi:type VI secretion system protein ImpE
MNAKEYYEAGQLQEAVAAQTEAVKAHPTDVARRGFLCELLCFAGELERADLQLDAIGQQDPQSMLGVSLFRQLVRAEQARQQFYREGRLPEFLDRPAPVLQMHLEASICIREGKPEKAVPLLEEAEKQRTHVSGVFNGDPFDDLRDLDDLSAAFFEVLTTNGKYYWIPMEWVESLTCSPPSRPRDLLWRRAHMIVRDGPDGEVFLPALYPGSHADDDDRIRLGRATDWRSQPGTPVRGVGQRMFLVGDQDRPILSIEEITFGTSNAGGGSD